MGSDDGPQPGAGDQSEDLETLVGFDGAVPEPEDDESDEDELDDESELVDFAELVSPEEPLDDSLDVPASLVEFFDFDPRASFL